MHVQLEREYPLAHEWLELDKKLYASCWYCRTIVLVAALTCQPYFLRRLAEILLGQLEWDTQVWTWRLNELLVRFQLTFRWYKCLFNRSLQHPVRSYKLTLHLLRSSLLRHLQSLHISHSQGTQLLVHLSRALISCYRTFHRPNQYHHHSRGSKLLDFS